MDNKIKSDSEYAIDWRANLGNLGPVIAFTMKDLPRKIENIQTTAFVITRENWVNAGFSGCSVPSHILLDHSNENVASANIANIDKLKEKIELWEKDLPKVTHCGEDTFSGIVNLCGMNNGSIASDISLVTCPCCIQEVFSKTEFEAVH